MKKRKRRLSRAQRAKISRGLRRYWRGVRAQRAKRNAQARNRRRLKKIQAQLKAEKRERPRTEEWELTIRYAKKGKALGVTMRITAPMGTPREVVEIVAKRAGMPHGRVEQGFEVRDINWQKPRKTTPYGDDVEKGLQVPGWTELLKESDIEAHLRLDKVK